MTHLLTHGVQDFGCRYTVGLQSCTMRPYGERGVSRMDEYISRQAVLNKINERQRKLIYCFGFENDAVKIMDIAKSIVTAIPAADVVPTEPQEIGYGQCANAMLKTWMDNVVTDGEYNRIMDRLNKLYFSGDEKKE